MGMEENAGLTSPEAAARLARDGSNELPSAGRAVRGRSPGRWSASRCSCCCSLQRQSISRSAICVKRSALLASVFVVIGITFYQERKTERALDALRELSSPRAQVLRDGEWRSVAGREVVVGDVVRMKEGDRVPADAVLFTSSLLMADESLLTGESMPVRKARTVSDRSCAPGGDDLPTVYSGTLRHARAGHGAGGRDRASDRSRQDRHEPADLGPEASPLQRETRPPC